MSICRSFLSALLVIVITASGAWAASVADLTAKAEKGDAEAQYALGMLYMDGTPEVAKSPTDAAKWLRKAADQGNGLAQRNLSGLYMNGVGVEKDQILALMWMKLAVKSGAPNAERLEKITAGQLKQSQIAEAEKMAAEWKPTK
jgi:TPR repeat protein